MDGRVDGRVDGRMDGRASGRVRPAAAREKRREEARHECTGSEREGCRFVESEGQLVCTLSGRVVGPVYVDGAATYKEREQDRNARDRVEALTGGWTRGAGWSVAKAHVREFGHTPLARQEAAMMADWRADNNGNRVLRRPTASPSALQAIIDGLARHLMHHLPITRARAVLRYITGTLYAVDAAAVDEAVRACGGSCPGADTDEREWLVSHPVTDAVCTVLRNDIQGVRDRRDRVVFGGRGQDSAFVPALEAYDELVGDVNCGVITSARPVKAIPRREYTCPPVTHTHTCPFFFVRSYTCPGVFFSYSKAGGTGTAADGLYARHRFHLARPGCPPWRMPAQSFPWVIALTLTCIGVLAWWTMRSMAALGGGRWPGRWL